MRLKEVNMFYQKNLEKTLSGELFRNPTSEYRGAPFWSWNCQVSEDMVDEQIEIYKEMGMGGFHIHARTGLETPYMGERFLELVKRANARGKEQGMLCYLYDEDRYPSGAAGGKVTENLQYRQRFLKLLSYWSEEYCPNREAFEAQIQEGKKPIGYYLTSYHILLDEEGCLRSYCQVTKDQEVTEGRVWHLYLRLAKESPWFNDQTYLDVLNPKAVEAFIKETHCKYYEALGEDFGKSVPSIFTDEPQMAGKFSFSTPFDTRDATVSFTDDMDDSFREAYGISLLEVLPEILWQLPKGEISVHRYHYHDHLAERFARSFSDTIGNWCQMHQIALTGHFMSERTLYSQTLALADAMRLYRSFQIPGIDILTDAKEFTTAKQAVSVARQYGREAVMCECYGAMNWNWDFKGHKLQGDWLAALGITIRCHHLTFMSMEGESKRDWPASIGYQSPWYKKYPYVEDHFARVNTALTRGKALTKVGVIYPMESYWIHYGPNSQTKIVRDQLDDNYDKLTQWLLYGLVDYDLISESLLPGQCEPDKVENTLPVGEMTYEAVVVPDLHTIRSTTLDRLERFAQAGGMVIFAGGVPYLVDGVKSDRARKLAESCEVVRFDRADLLGALENYRTIEVRLKNGMLADNMVYQMRQDGTDRWLFLCHVNRKRNVVDVPQQYTIRVPGCFRPTLYDTITGEITPCKASISGNNTVISRKMYGEDSLLLKLEPGVPDSCAPEQVLFDGSRHKLWEPQCVTLSEPNVLLLDYAEYAFDDGPWQERTDILSIDNQFRKVLGLPRRQDKFKQPWCLPDEQPEHKVTLRFTIASELEVVGAQLAMERPENARLTWNGVEVDTRFDGYYVDKCIQTVSLPKIQKGSNILVMEIPFSRKTNLEWCYILGAFGVRVEGNYAYITQEPKQLRFGDVVQQGLPFYTGNLRYEMQLSLSEDKEQVVLEVPHFAAPVLDVQVDGEDKGVIAYAPHRLQLGAMSAGSHALTITAYGNRFNGFGTIHNANDEFRWYGPDAYRTSGSQWSDSYLLDQNGILSPVYILYEGD